MSLPIGRRPTDKALAFLGCKYCHYIIINTQWSELEETTSETNSNTNEANLSTKRTQCICEMCQQWRIADHSIWHRHRVDHRRQNRTCVIMQICLLQHTHRYMHSTLYKGTVGLVVEYSTHNFQAAVQISLGSFAPTVCSGQLSLLSLAG